MSKTKRYLAKCPWYAIETQEHPMGEFVLYSDYACLKAEVNRLTKAANEISHAWSVYENGLIETPEWVKRSQVRDAISRLWNAAKEGKQS